MEAFGRRITKDGSMDGSMDDDTRDQRSAPGGSSADHGEEGRITRFRNAAAGATGRVRARTAKAVTAARPVVVPILTQVVPVVATAAVGMLLASGRDTGRADDGEPSGGGPSPSCRECGRRLTDPLSRQAGYGPTCARHRLT
ncbi:DUF6011 domain-containing protein [Streptomyces sp. NPDC097619]|uniref:DUF6011 domain-containing protein n=1 Tax=Streptomyces sp. NPDC097619 TaxID=3157228 RepID=UPI003325460B